MAPTPAAGAPAAASDVDTAGRWLGGIGLVLAALALGFGLGAYTRSRQVRRPEIEPADGVEDDICLPQQEGASR